MDESFLENIHNEWLTCSLSPIVVSDESLVGALSVAKVPLLLEVGGGLFKYVIA